MLSWKKKNPVQATLRANNCYLINVSNAADHGWCRKFKKFKICFGNVQWPVGGLKMILPNWSCFHTWTALEDLQWEHKHPNQANQTLNRLQTASSLVQSPCNVWLSRCVNRKGHFTSSELMKCLTSLQHDVPRCHLNRFNQTENFQ